MNESVSLDTIGLKHGTDKASSHHDYLGFYEFHFAPIRAKPLTILEIGVLNGASVRTWEDYFPNAKIVGADKDILARRHQRGRVAVEYMDQSNLEDLVRVGVKHGPFDIVIEDGSHMWEHQITSLRTIFPFVREGGFYVVEDLQTNYGSLRAQYQGVARTSCVEFLKLWLDLHVADAEAPLEGIEDAFLRTYGRAAEIISFYRRACLIRKRASPRPPELAVAGPYETPAEGADLAPLGLTAHCSHAGDVFGPAGFVDLGADRFAIQGLAIDLDEDVLEYRVRWPDATWSDWTGTGTYAGTRGRAIELTGFAIRLRPAARLKYGLRAIGKFAGGEELISVGDGEECTTATGARLRGLQVDLTRRGV